MQISETQVCEKLNMTKMGLQCTGEIMDYSIKLSIWKNFNLVPYLTIYKPWMAETPNNEVFIYIFMTSEQRRIS